MPRFYHLAISIILPKKEIENEANFLGLDFMAFVFNRLNLTFHNHINILTFLFNKQTNNQKLHSVE